MEAFCCDERLLGGETSRLAFGSPVESGFVVGLKSSLFQPQVSLCKPKGLGCLLTLCPFTSDICDSVMEPELSFRALQACGGEHGVAAGDKIEKGLGQSEMWQRKALPPWELWMPRRCPHLSWSQWSHQSTLHSSTNAPLYSPKCFPCKEDKEKLLKSLLSTLLVGAMNSIQHFSNRNSYQVLHFSCARHPAQPFVYFLVSFSPQSDGVSFKISPIFQMEILRPGERPPSCPSHMAWK